LKAVICESFGPPETLVLGDLATPEVKRAHVRVKVRYCSVNFPDVLMIQGLHQYKREPPFVPGGEISGTVLELGPEVVDITVGDAVAGLSFYGGFAQEVVIPQQQVYRLPRDIDMAAACCLAGTYGTALHAFMQRAALRPAESVLVLGASGGSGTAAVQIGKLLGARIIAAVGSDDKMDFVLKCGADEAFNYSSESIKDAMRRLTAQRGFDVIYDPVGGDHADAALRAMGWNGRYLVIGFASGTIPAFRANLPLLKGCSIVGVFAGEFIAREPAAARCNFDSLVQWVVKGALKPAISEIIPIERTREALRTLLDRKAVGKIVVALPDD
jgi:NADPH2:quinone reductase